MPKYFLPRRANDISELRKTFREGWADLRAKRDRGLSRKAQTPRDAQIISVMDGVEAGTVTVSAANGEARERLVGLLLTAHRLQRGIDPQFEYLHVSIINDGWVTSDEHTVIDLSVIAQTSTAILNEIAPDWTAAIEFAAFTNRKHASGGKLLSPHVHAIVRGHGFLAEAERVAARWNSRLRATIQGATAVDVRRIGETWLDLAHVIRYPHKPPNRCKTVYINPEKNLVGVHESEKGDRFVRYLRMFQVLSLIDQRELMFAGGAGVALHEWALARVEEEIAREAGAADLVLGRKDVRAFWADFIPRLGWARFQVPTILAQ